MPKNILYTATWCEPCTKLKERLELSGYLDKVEIVVIDDIVQKLKTDIGLRSIPALMTEEGLIVESNVIFNLITGENNGFKQYT